MERTRFGSQTWVLTLTPLWTAAVIIAGHLTCVGSTCFLVAGDGVWEPGPPPNPAPWSSPQLSKPEKVSIPERYVELDPEEPPSLEELQARYRKAEKIRNILARSRSALPLPRPDGPRGLTPWVSQLSWPCAGLARVRVSPASSSLEREGWHSACHQQITGEACLGHPGSLKHKSPVLCPGTLASVRSGARHGGEGGIIGAPSIRARVPSHRPVDQSRGPALS